MHTQQVHARRAAAAIYFYSKEIKSPLEISLSRAGVNHLGGAVNSNRVQLLLRFIWNFLESSTAYSGVAAACCVRAPGQ